MGKKFVLILIAALGFSLFFSMNAYSNPQGEIVIATTSLGREIFTPLMGASSELVPMGMWNEKLLYRGHGQDYELYPGLAESWTVSNDGMTITFNLRKNINFNEGWGPFTAEDVKYSLELVGREDSVNINKHLIRDGIKNIEIVNPYEVKLHLKKPVPDMLTWLSDTYGFIMIVSKKYYESVGEKEAAKHPVGTGPFVFKEHILGDHLTVEAVDNHWRKTPDFKTVTIKVVPEESTRVAMLKAGEADVIIISTPSLKELEDAGYNVISNQDSVSCSVIYSGLTLEKREAYDPSQPWTPIESDNALKVRKALDLAINKQEILQYVLKGKGRPLSVHEFVPGRPTTNPAWEPLPYDPKEAKQLLAEAGYPNGFTKPITMYIFNFPSSPEMRDIGEAVSRYWEAIGLKVNRVTLEDTAWKDLWYPRGPKARWSASPVCNTQYVEPVTFYSTSSLTTTRSHFVMESEKTDQMIKAAAESTDPEKKKELQLALGQYLYDNHLAAPIAMKDILWAVSGKIAGWDLNNGNNNLHNLEFIQIKK